MSCMKLKMMLVSLVDLSCENNCSMVKLYGFVWW